MDNIPLYDKYAKAYASNTNQKILQFQLNKFISMLKKKAKILDVGCGCGRDAEYFKSEGFSVTGIDLSEGMLNEAKNKAKDVELLKMDMRKLELKKNTFNGIWCMASLLEIPKNEVGIVLKEFNKVLKKEGVLYISTKEGGGEQFLKKEIYENEPKFYAFYKQTELEDLLKENGFEILYSIVSEDEGTKWVEIFAKKI